MNKYYKIIVLMVLIPIMFRGNQFKTKFTILILLLKTLDFHLIFNHRVNNNNSKKLMVALLIMFIIDL